MLDEKARQARRLESVDRPTACTLAAQCYLVATWLLPVAAAAGQPARASTPGNLQVVFRTAFWGSFLFSSSLRGSPHLHSLYLYPLCVR